MHYRNIEICIINNLRFCHSVKVNKKYYPQILLEECKYEIKKANMENHINDDLEPSSSDDESDNESENESENE